MSVAAARAGNAPDISTTRVTFADSPYTMLQNDREVFCDTDGGPITVNLLAGVDARKHRLINTGTAVNDVTVNPSGAELLLGLNASVALLDGDIMIVTFEPTEGWW